MNFLRRLFKQDLDASELLVQTLMAWLRTSNWQTSLRFLEKHPELLTNDAETTLTQLSAESSLLTRLEALAHWVLLRECRRKGLSAAYENRLQNNIKKNQDISGSEELNHIIPSLSLGGRRFPPSDKQISEGIKHYLNAHSVAEQKQIISDWQHILLTKEAEDYSTQILENAKGNDQASQLIETFQDTISRCRQEDIDSVFAHIPSTIIFQNMKNHERSETRGAILIGHGFLPTEVDVRDALKMGWIKNCHTVSTTSYSLSIEPSKSLHFSTYMAIQKERGWGNSGGLQSMKITAVDGREMYSVYPLLGEEALPSLEGENIEVDTTSLSSILSFLEVPGPAQELPYRVELYRKAISLIDPQIDPEQWAWQHSSLALALIDTRLQGDRAENLEEAKRHFEQAITVWTKEKSPIKWAATIHNLAHVYHVRIRGERVENIEQTIDYYRQALEIRTREEMPEQWGMTNFNLGNAYIDRIKGERSINVESAIQHYNSALLVRTEESNPIKWANTIIGLGSAYQDRMKGSRSINIEHAIEYYLKALRVFTNNTNTAQWARTRMNLANAYSSRIEGDPIANIELAIENYQQGLQVMTLQNMPIEWSDTKHNLGNTYRRRIIGNHESNIEKAIAACQEALQVRVLSIMPNAHRQTQDLLGMIHFENQDWIRAYEAYSSAIEAGDLLLSSAYTEQGRRAEVRETSTLFARVTYCLLRVKQPAEALRQLEKGKTRLLAEALAIGNANLAKLPEKQQHLIQEYRDRVHELEAKMRVSNDIPNQRNDRDMAEALRVSRHDLMLLIDRIRDNRPDFMPTGLPLSDILLLIPLDGVLVAPFVTSKGSASYVIPHGTKIVTNEHIIHLPTLTIDYLSELLQGSKDEPTLGGWLGAYDHFRRNVGRNARDNWFQQVNTTTSKLWDSLVGPIHERLQTLNLSPGAPVLLMPQGGLGLLPLHAAWRQVDGQPRYFCDDYTITYAPSAYALHISHQRAAQPERQARSLFAAINPTRDLKYTPLEGEAIAQLFSSAKQTILHEANATTAAFPTAAKGHTYIHYSGHGSYNWRDPLQSGLRLADKAYTLSDILSGLDLSTCRLVTLSACETGMTEFQQSPDEYVGLPAGFLQAGATAVISTLWAVNDLSTMLLMERFYQLHLQDNLDMPIALRQAQLWLRDVTAQELADRFGEERMELQNNRLTLAQAGEYWRRFAAEDPDSKPFAHPYYWAAFTFTGA